MSRRGAGVIVALAAIVLAVAIGAAFFRPQTADGPVFRVILIKPGNFLAEEEAEAAAAGGKVPPEAIDFQADALDLPLADVRRNPAGGAFQRLLRTLPAVAAVSQPVVFRLKDGRIAGEGGGDALSEGNTGVLVVPADIVMLFDDAPTAYFQIKRRIAGLE